MNKTAIAPAVALLAVLAASAHAGDGRGGAAPAGHAVKRTVMAQATTGGPAATPAPGATDSPAPSTGAMGAGPAPSSAGGGDKGQAVYAQTCVACHGAGVAGAPKLGDKADWGPRVAQGKGVLYQHALQGFTGRKGVMPPKGGNTALPDADVKAAVDYMAAQAK